MAGIKEFINNDELSDIIINALPDGVKNYYEWEFTLKYQEKLIDTLELWKTEKRNKKDKIIIDLTKIFSAYQLKNLFFTIIIKFGTETFEN